jgi:hypothetical protein
MKEKPVRDGWVFCFDTLKGLHTSLLSKVGFLRARKQFSLDEYTPFLVFLYR